MKRYFPALLFAIALTCAAHNSNAAFYKRQLHTVENTTAFRTMVSNVETTALASTNASDAGIIELPRGRGNGRAAVKSLVLGIFSLIPFVGLILAPLSYANGIPNLNRRRKGRGAAMTGVIFATLGLAFSILCVLILILA